MASAQRGHRAEHIGPREDGSLAGPAPVLAPPPLPPKLLSPTPEEPGLPGAMAWESPLLPSAQVLKLSRGRRALETTSRSRPTDSHEHWGKRCRLFQVMLFTRNNNFYLKLSEGSDRASLQRCSRDSLGNYKRRGARAAAFKLPTRRRGSPGLSRPVPQAPRVPPPKGASLPARKKQLHSRRPHHPPPRHTRARTPTETHVWNVSLRAPLLSSTDA